MEKSCLDGCFIAAALGLDWPSIPPVDNLELALLLHPNLPAHQLSALAEAVGLPVNDLGAQWAELSLDSNFGAHQVSQETLHNALTDVYVLYRVYDHFLHKLNQSGSVQELLAALLPEAFALEAV